MHHLFTAAEGRMNPYERAIDVIGRALAPFDDDDLIPVYGFGDGRTNDRKLFGFRAGDAPCRGFGEALARYRALAPRARLAGPTSFAPLIRKACAIVAAEEGAYHILLIVADGQVTRDSSTRAGALSRQERATVDAIVEASHYPLSIVMVGVGDGPWDVMEDFDDELPERQFDNFQFVRMDAILGDGGGGYAEDGGGGGAGERAQADFALHALMEIPEQYAAITRLNLADACAGRARTPVAVLPPPPGSGGGGGGGGGHQHIPVAQPL